MTDDNKPKSKWKYRLATASLILGVISFITCGITSIPGLALGIISMILIRRRSGLVASWYQALWGTIISTIALILFSGAYMVITHEDKQEMASYCAHRMKQLGTAFQMYASENDNCMPPSDKWVDLLHPYIKNGPLICPSAKKDDIGYAMNRNLNSLSLDVIDESSDFLVLLYDAIGNDGYHGGPELIPSPGRHIGCTAPGLEDADEAYKSREDISYVNNFCFIDGHVKSFTKEKTRILIWKPAKITASKTDESRIRK